MCTAVAAASAVHCYTRTTRGQPTSPPNHHIQHLLADMSLNLSSTSRVRSNKRARQNTTIDESLAEQQSPHVASIHILDNDALLNVFYLYRPFVLAENEDVFNRPSLVGETPESELWDRGRWWYRLAHVCQRWRNLILHSVSYLGLSLACTNGTPVESMLAHSPPLPLTVDYRSEGGITSEDEEGITLALEQRHRVRHLRLNFPVRNLLKFVMAIDEEFPILEYLILYPETKDSTASLVLPETFQTPNLRHLMLEGFTCPIRTRLHPTAVGLVALYLAVYHPSSYFQPNVLPQWISFMPRLECLTVLFTFLFPTVMWRGNSHMRQSRHTLHSLTFACSGSEALPLIWKWLFVGSQPLASKACKSDSSSNSRFPFHVSRSL
ncbi:hypothetical protein BGY98DRAFT_930189 [Russula aff. rugulosa BPL654]|nr:hypothetical protein BGY98DRAFT_930189 [Russula aff. rugulosa BPL654]